MCCVVVFWYSFCIVLFLGVVFRLFMGVLLYLGVSKKVFCCLWVLVKGVLLFVGVGKRGLFSGCW